MATVMAALGGILILSATGSGAVADPPGPPTSPLFYSGQGIDPLQQQCDENNTPYLLFIFTYGGNFSPTNVTLHGITVTNQQEMGNETHFTTAYVDPSTLIGVVNVTWSGDVGQGANLVISHGCPGETKTTTPAETTPVETTPVETTPVETTPVETTPVETTPVTTPASSSSSFGISGASTSHPATKTSTALGIAGTTAGPIPNGVSAGLTKPVTNAGMKAWGTVLLLVGGSAGLLAGLWPTRRRAH